MLVVILAIVYTVVYSTRLLQRKMELSNIHMIMFIIMHSLHNRAYTKYFSENDSLLGYSTV
jgi:hypothetical protein